jgi:pyoverdine/dityrosine biosynthesis protein Dit1
MAANADFQKYDDGLRMTIDCDPDTAGRIEDKLLRAERGLQHPGGAGVAAALAVDEVDVVARARRRREAGHQYDDGLRMTIDCDPDTAGRIEDKLLRAERDGILDFG